MESQLRVHECYHTREQLLLLRLWRALEAAHLLYCCLYSDVLVVDLDELSFSQFLYLVSNLRFTDVREVLTHLLVYALETLQVSLGHLATGCREEYRFEDKGQQLLAELCLFQHDIIMKGLIRRPAAADWHQQMVLDVAQGRLQEGISCVLYAVGYPRVEMQKLSFSC